MSKIAKNVKSLLLLFGLLVTVAMVRSYLLAQRQQREAQAEFLNLNFIQVRLQKGKVLLETKKGGMVSCSNPGIFDKTTVFPIDFEFRAADEHGAGTYQISGIESDGVVIHFDTQGTSPSPFSTSSGFVKLLWK